MSNKTTTIDKKEIVNNIIKFKLLKMFSIMRKKYIINGYFHSKHNLPSYINEMNEISYEYLKNGIFYDYIRHIKIKKLKDFSKYLDEVSANQYIKSMMEYINQKLLVYDFLYNDIKFVKKFKRTNKRTYDSNVFSRRYYMLNVFGFLGNKTNDKKHSFSYGYFVKVPKDSEFNTFFDEHKNKFIEDVIGLGLGDNSSFFKKENSGYSILVRPVRYFDVNIDRVSAGFVKQMMFNFKPTDFVLFLKKYAYRFNLIPRLDVDIKYKMGVGEKRRMFVLNKIVDLIKEKCSDVVSEIYVSSSRGLHIYTYIKNNVSLSKTNKYLAVNLAVLNYWVRMYKSINEIINTVMQDKDIRRVVESISIDNRSFDIKQGFYYEGIRPFGKDGYSFLIYRNVDNIEKTVLKAGENVDIKNMKRFLVDVDIDENIKKYLYENLYKLFDIRIVEFERGFDSNTGDGVVYRRKPVSNLEMHIVEILKNPDDYLKEMQQKIQEIKQEYIKKVLKNRTMVIKKYGELVFILESYYNEVVDYFIVKLKERNIDVDYSELKNILINMLHDNLDKYIISLIRKSIYNKAIKTAVVYTRTLNKKNYDNLGSFSAFNYLRYGIELYLKELNIIKDDEVAKDFAIDVAVKSVENIKQNVISVNKLHSDILLNLDKYGKTLDLNRETHINLIKFVRDLMMKQNKNHDTMKLSEQDLIDVFSVINEAIIDGIFKYFETKNEVDKTEDGSIKFKEKTDKKVQAMIEILKEVSNDVISDKLGYKSDKAKSILNNRVDKYFKNRCDGGWLIWPLDNR